MVTPVYIGTTVPYGKHYLDAAAAASWFRMVRDGCPAGGITDALRTPQEQEAVFRKHYTTNYAASAKIDRRQWNGQFWYRAYQPGGKKPWPSAATPGSPQARHVAGLSLDLNGATKAWVRANGHRYGWIKDLVSGEDWHMEYQSWRDPLIGTTTVSNPGTVPGVPSVPGINPPNPLTPVKEEDIMASLEDLKNVVAPLERALNTLKTDVENLKARDYAFKLDGPAQAFWFGVGASTRMHLDGAAYAALGSPRVIPLPPEDKFWARTLVYGVGEVFRKEGGDQTYVLTGDGLVPVSRATYEAWGQPLITDYPVSSALWALPILPSV